MYAKICYKANDNSSYFNSQASISILIYIMGFTWSTEYNKNIKANKCTWKYGLNIVQIYHVANFIYDFILIYLLYYNIININNITMII